MNHAASLPFPGHALFVTRIGVCGLAWTAAAICAVQLPEASWGETRERMLLGLSKRHALQPQRGPAAYGAVTSISAVPGFAVQAMAGVQCLLAGVNAQIEPGWAQPSAEAVAAGVLGDMRQDRGQGAVGVLPDLQEIALDEFAVPAFHSRVYAFTRALAPGRTSTYGEVAAALGEAGAARAVGQALGANPFAPIVPCHRVLAAGRAPGGFSGGQGALTKLRMLEIEGGAWGGTQSLFAD
ncbi:MULTISPECIES: methylated-DNA--[protein]-cysteine S-methyltransferase [Comamonas]|uniref:Methylated-DNA-protein-cysteine methyltransferase n=1 Tax=Comamonas thiooxydans TaxID=363952 RepID=A0A0E3C1L8_9BURK|nr:MULTISPECIES: methylated-DNA--[protein]-cysteine S-methyltransferase [Comamonas]KGH12277.1 methylated-DNA-protein-cysteine methyltransferase [Comamonas thiooxydans]KGH19188.1 methylated-DNA-protein-cysteine methyltransferase [Comamonas thiooxydans]KGH23163.1 methylated-DNA-protein-cysteine methyltransferase [Comamonas thiooxydans]MDO1475644.1 methylated-DNA--[protein]-cysteine S-methyltransferase [Comamonas thiooxydans]QOQ80441.1 methylated-DNA--[protein]-cysteine S-methyltransferase [Comam